MIRRITINGENRVLVGNEDVGYIENSELFLFDDDGYAKSHGSFESVSAIIIHVAERYK